jgi:hypothetical protein
MGSNPILAAIYRRNFSCLCRIPQCRPYVPSFCMAMVSR